MWVRWRMSMRAWARLLCVAAGWAAAVSETRLCPRTTALATWREQCAPFEVAVES